jgi:protein-S-isoprenylcysteine O-methyltransferase Ste14
MFQETFFRIALWLIFGVMIIIQVCFSLSSRRAREHGSADRRLVECEGSWAVLVRAIRSIVLVVFLLLSVINGSWLRLLSVPFPAWLRWVGIMIGLFSLVIYIWSRLTIGKEWSSDLRLLERHLLVTTGPYSRVRHPIYLALILFMTSITLVAANWLLVVFLIISTTDLVLRITKEEQMMIEEFGDEYEIYMQRTGKLLPK